MQIKAARSVLRHAGQNETCVGAKMRMTTLVNATLLSLVVLIAGACYETHAPAIVPGRGEDVGEVIQYSPFVLSLPKDLSHRVVFTRKADNDYLVTLDQAGKSSNVLGSASFWRVGDRGDDPVFLVQFDDNPGAAATPDKLYLVGLLALRADGVGVFALIDDADPQIAALAASHGLVLAQVQPKRHMGAVRSATATASIAGFLKDALKKRLVSWEDWTGISLVEEVGGAI